MVYSNRGKGLPGDEGGEARVGGWEVLTHVPST